jgi:transcriptional regulator with XRE-family HTH domain
MTEKKEKEAIRVWKQRKEVFRLRAKGCTVRQISEKTGVSTGNINNYLASRENIMKSFAEVALFENDIYNKKLGVGLNKLQNIKNSQLKSIVSDYAKGVSIKDIIAKHNITKITSEYVLAIIVDNEISTARKRVVAKVHYDRASPDFKVNTSIQKEKYRAAKVDEWDFGNEQFIVNDGAIPELRRWL